MPSAMKAAHLLTAIALGTGVTLATTECAEANGRRGGATWQNRGGGHGVHHHGHRHHHHGHGGLAFYGLGLGFGLGAYAYGDAYDYWPEYRYAPPPRAYYVAPTGYPSGDQPYQSSGDPPYPPVPAYPPPPLPGAAEERDGAGSETGTAAPARAAALLDDPASWPMP